VGDPKMQNLANPQSLNTYSYSVDNPIAKKDPSGRDDAGVVDTLPPMLEGLGALAVAAGTSEFWAPIAFVAAGTGAVMTAGDAIYNLYHNSGNSAPGLSEATRLVSGDNEGPINTNPKGPKWPTTAVKIAAVTSILSLAACGDVGFEECGNVLQAYSNYLNGNTTAANANQQAPLLVSNGSGTGTISNWSFSQLKLYTTPSGAVVRSDGTVVSGPPGSSSGGSGGGGGYISSNGQTPIKNSNGSTSYCLGVCKQQ
jgi:hypothetical protein